MPVHRRSSLAAAAPRPYAATIVFLLGFLGVLLLPSAAAGQDADVIDAFSRQIAADVEADGIGGITAAVFKGDQVLWSQGFGWADPENRVPAGVRTIYRTGSISKSVTAILMADLVEEGTVALDDAVVDHLPEVAGFGDPPADMAPITLRQLASHTAGLIREPELEGAAAGPIEDWGYKILASIPHTRYDTMPGARYQYSNIGYGVLGYALQRAAGTSFMDLVEDRLFEPLGMRSSTFIAGPDMWRRVAVGYVNWDDGTVDPDLPALEHEGRGYKVPNGGVYATVGDLATFAAAVMGMTEHELLEPATRRDVMTVQTPEDPDAGYGLGFSIRPVALEGGDDVRFVGHGGSVAGYNMYLVFEPESGYGVALGRNYNRGATSLGEAGNGLLQALLEAGG
ncbi:MAG: beta-lactamase family protein [Gemmatimonadales bacterium]|nr:beta-lactamase family protein [Gemmatimonadales bacterium]MYG20452.1 beta-lactamase family protein [Gemmatimonadales bacterium]